MKTQTETTFPFPTYPKPIMDTYKKTAEAKASSAVEYKKYKGTLLDKAKRSGVGIVHIFDTQCPLGGLTIAFSPSTTYSSCTMVEVSVNTCSKQDTFSRSLGTVGALEKFFGGETIKLPLLQVFTKEDLPWVVKQAFTSLYDTIK